MIVGSVVLGFAGMSTDKFLCDVLRLCRINGDGSQVALICFNDSHKIGKRKSMQTKVSGQGLSWF